MTTVSEGGGEGSAKACWVLIRGARSGHDATYPARAAEYGPLLASLLETGRSLDGRTVAKMQLRREIFRSRLNAVFGGIDLLIVPVMNVAAPTLADLAAAGRAPAAIEARLRFTAPFDMSGHPTLTLPGGATNDGLPVGFQIVGRPMCGLPTIDLSFGRA